MFRPLVFTVLLVLFMAGCASYSREVSGPGYYEPVRNGGGPRASEARYKMEQKPVSVAGKVAKPASPAEPTVSRAVAREESYDYAADKAEYEVGSSTGDASADYDDGGSYGGESYGYGSLAPSEEEGVAYGAAAPAADAALDRIDTGVRMVVYRAEIWTAVDSVGDATKNIEKLAGEIGGRVDSVSTQSGAASATIVLRVPAAKFDEALVLLEKVGEITGKRISADDVTEEFRDTELRLRMQKTVLARFEELLKKTTDPKERVGILREMERISADIAALEQRLAYLKDQAEFSTITLYLTAAVRDAVKRYQPLPFRWLRLLDPDMWPSGEFAGFAFEKGPEGFFAARENYENHAEAWLFQSPQGSVRVRLQKVENYPEADTAFWTEAFAIEMGNRLYKQIADEKMGQFMTRTYEIPGGRRYLAGFVVKEEDIFVVEALFDTTEDHAATAEVVKKFIGAVEVKP